MEELNMTRRTLGRLILIILLLAIFRYPLLNIFTPKISSCDKAMLEINYWQKDLRKIIDNYQELLKIVNYDEDINDNYLITSLLLRNQSTFYDTIIIKYGQDKNLTKDMAVVSNKGLIGIIDKVSTNYSFVKLLTSGDLSIAVRVGDTYGIISGYEDGLIVVSKISNWATLAIGEAVYTSAYGPYPSHIYIGQIKKIEEIQTGIEKIIYVQSEVDFNHLRYVYVNTQVGS